MRTKTTIKAELTAALAEDPPDTERVAELTAELKRARRRRRRTLSAPPPAAERSVAPVQGLTEQDHAAVDTWPPELRARLHRGSLSRVISPWRD
ncbi:hypothetical protein [Streptomyces sp. Root1310]|uniref:hypothetical protein n=1 Tax=Streptomyces sp. Root1310 TaxID=1736452 RepID=UPI00070A5C43|nr:hypothetical protein [Streptomyces sp. Root1310]KQX63433.1 hypothetical protein ASD48_26095 [Streptomyces sp. Root1310]